MCFFGFLSFKASGEKNSTESIVYLCLAILFQPIVKISLGRTIWNMVDVAVGIALIASALLIKDKRSQK